MIIAECLLLGLMSTAMNADQLPETGTYGHYAVLTCKVNTAPPFEVVDFIYGPYETIDNEIFLWWQLEARLKEGDDAPIFRLRALTSYDPLIELPEKCGFQRYILNIPSTDETLEYKERHKGTALLPVWKDFDYYFIPHVAFGSQLQDNLPETLEYLGHVLSLRYVGHGKQWESWENVKVLNLDRELLVGTGRNFKDSEGKRLPQTPERKDYTYVKFTQEDYKIMISAGVNLFTVSPDQEQWVRGEAVFYLRGSSKDSPLNYPADLYRSNYIGSVMFMDEPAIIMVGDKNIHNTLRYFSDASAVVQKRIRERYFSGGSYSAFNLERQLEKNGVNLGDMRLEQYDFPAWETIFEMAYYELSAEVTGIVHEGRYQLDQFNNAVYNVTGSFREHTKEEMLRYHFAFLRGAARAFNKHWGTSIYGQCDPEISPLAISLAYDMGARYIWFWTSDHDHHVPWNEQLELVRYLRQHEAKHPRESIFAEKQILDKAIAIPYGYFLSLENLWWVRALDKDKNNETYQRYYRLLNNAIRAVHEALDSGEEFDIVVDDGREITGYKKVVMIKD